MDQQSLKEKRQTITEIIIEPDDQGNYKVKAFDFYGDLINMALASDLKGLQIVIGLWCSDGI